MMIYNKRLKGYLEGYTVDWFVPDEHNNSARLQLMWLRSMSSFYTIPIPIHLIPSRIYRPPNMKQVILLAFAK
jgi:hypothetical protein